MTLINTIHTLFKHIVNYHLSSEEYHLDIILTDKNNIVIHEEHKVFMDYTLLDLHHTVENIKELSGKVKP